MKHPQEAVQGAVCIHTATLSIQYHYYYYFPVFIYRFRISNIILLLLCFTWFYTVRYQGYTNFVCCLLSLYISNLYYYGYYYFHLSVLNHIFIICVHNRSFEFSTLEGSANATTLLSIMMYKLFP